MLKLYESGSCSTVLDPVVLFIELYKMVLTFESAWWMKS